MFRSSSFRTRILLMLLVLIVLVQGAAFVAVYGATGQNARSQIESALKSSALVFNALMERREVELAQAASLVSGDFAFKTAFSLRHRPTMVTALKNLRNRIGGDEAVLLDLDGTLLAADPEVSAPGERTAFVQLVRRAEESRTVTASGVDFVAGRPYVLVAVPLMAPVPAAWILLGFNLNDNVAAQLKELTGAEVSLGRAEGGRWIAYASTLPAERRAQLGDVLVRSDLVRGEVSNLDVGGDLYVTMLSPLGEFTTSALDVVLQRPLNQAMAAYNQLRLFLGLLAIGAVVASAIGAGLIARNVTRPIRRLVDAVQRIGNGDYATEVNVRRGDEIGTLADAVNQMTKGLAERDRARDMLGKMVSPQVAAEVMSKRVELGGEERVVSVLFADIRGFSRLSETLRPAELVSILNAFLTALSDVVERHGGVVDKFIGDALMALFGAPLLQPDHAVRAVAAALDMSRTVDDLNRQLSARGQTTIDFGIGVNTAAVVVGNMGSRRRLNYTVIGDGVNLAARVEKLTREYDVRAIVTASTQAEAPGFLFREIDRVRVRGREEPVRIFEPLGETAAFPEESLQRLALWHDALKRYRSRDWAGAEGILAQLQEGEQHSQLYALYRQRIETLRLAPPPAAWDGTFSQQSL